MAYETDRPEVVRATKARQGSWGRHIFWVLVISTVLAAIALLASWAINTPRLEGEGGQTRAAPTVAHQFSSPEPVAQQTSPLRP